MKKLLIAGVCVASGLFATATGWNDFTWRYSPAGHIPSIPLYYRQPLQTSPSKAELKADIENLQQELKELQAVLNVTPIQSHNNAKHACNCKERASRRHTARHAAKTAQPAHTK